MIMSWKHCHVFVSLQISKWISDWKVVLVQTCHADNQDVENDFETVADLLEESGIQIEKEDHINNDVIFIYVHKIFFVFRRCINNFQDVFVRKNFLQMRIGDCLERLR